MTTTSLRRARHISDRYIGPIPCSADICTRSCIARMWRVLVHPTSVEYRVERASNSGQTSACCWRYVLRSSWPVATCRSPLSAHQPAGRCNSRCYLAGLICHSPAICPQSCIISSPGSSSLLLVKLMKSTECSSSWTSTSNIAARPMQVIVHLS